MKLVYMMDLKSIGLKRPYGFDSRPRYQMIRAVKVRLKGMQTVEMSDPPNQTLCVVPLRKDG